MAALFTVLDVVGAIGFAGGLALILTSIQRDASVSVFGVVMALGGALFRALMATMAAGFGGEAAARAKTILRSAAARGLLHTRPGDRDRLGDALALAADGVERMDGYVARFAPAQAAASVTPVIVAVAMAFASPISAVIVGLTFIPFILGMALAGGAAAREADRQFDALRKLSGLFADRVRSLPLVLAFQAEDATTRALAGSAETLANRTLDVLRVAFLSSGVLEFFAALSVALVAVYCGFNLLHLLPFPTLEHLDLGRAIFVLALAPEAYLPMRRLAAAYHDRQAAEAAVDALAPCTRPIIEQPRRTLSAPPRVVFRHVSVVYPDEERPALDRFDLDLAPGESVALVGPTGAGKSTVLRLVLGMIEPTEGLVDVGGSSPGADGAPLAAWAGQTPMVIPGSLLQNIALVRKGASLALVVDAARRAGLLNTPGGLERQIDERGGGLSGGERRRLALARALLSDAPLVLLDEPTANLDLASETMLLPVIAEAMRGRTALIATHSPRVAALADRIVRLG